MIHTTTKKYILMNVRAVKHKDVHGKDKYYLFLNETEEDNLVIHVGLKTYTKVTDMTKKKTVHKQTVKESENEKK